MDSATLSPSSAQPEPSAGGTRLGAKGAGPTSSGSSSPGGTLLAPTGTVLGGVALPTPSGKKKKRNRTNTTNGPTQRKKKGRGQRKPGRVPSKPDDYRSSEDENESDAEDEGRSAYRKGGYHPVQVGDVFRGTYEILCKLGWGHFSTVWLAQDRLHMRFVAVKIVKSAPHYSEAAMDEIELLTAVNANDPRQRMPIVHLLDHFHHHGPHGTHVCMVFEALGVNLYDILKERAYAGLPLQTVRLVTRQILAGLVHLHSRCRIIHTDLKLENILVVPYAEHTEYLQKLYCQQRLQHAEKDNSGGEKGRLSPKIVESGCTVQKEADAKAEEESSSKGADVATGDRKLSKNQKRKQQKLRVETEGGITSPPSPQRTAQKGGTQSPKLKGKELRKVGEKESKIEGSEKKKPNQADPVAEKLSEVVTEWDQKSDMLQVRIADLGNACWMHKHFTAEVQTRQYRAPEVILGAPYGPPIDIWSLGCVVFELVTGDLLFDPKTGANHSKDDDHLAQILELVEKRRMPECLVRGKHSLRFLNRKRELKSIRDLKPWGIASVLEEKYELSRADALELESFLLPLLRLNPNTRPTAMEVLQHPWLQEEKRDERQAAGDAKGETSSKDSERKEMQALKKQINDMMHSKVATVPKPASPTEDLSKENSK